MYTSKDLQNIEYKTGIIISITVSHRGILLSSSSSNSKPFFVLERIAFYESRYDSIINIVFNEDVIPKSWLHPLQIKIKIPFSILTKDLKNKIKEYLRSLSPSYFEGFDKQKNRELIATIKNIISISLMLKDI